MNVVSVSCDDAIATFTMRDPARRNALSPAMLDQLSAAFDGLPADARAVVLRAGSDATVWCAGFDIGQLSPGRDPLAPDGALHALFRQIRECRAPVIGMVHGSAWGGGTDLALRCDILIGDPTSSFAFTPARLGLPYDDDGLLNALLRVGPALALEMFATAAPVPAERAVASGLLNHLVDAVDLERFTYDLARQIAANAPLSVTSAKQHIRALARALPLPTVVAQALGESRRRALASADYVEGLAAFRGKRPPIFTGS